MKKSLPLLLLLFTVAPAWAGPYTVNKGGSTALTDTLLSGPVQTAPPTTCTPYQDIYIDNSTSTPGINVCNGDGLTFTRLPSGNMTLQQTYTNSAPTPQIQVGAEGLKILGAHSEATAVQICDNLGSCTDAGLLYYDPGAGPILKSKTPRDLTFSIPTNKTGGWYDAENGCHILTIDPDAASPNAAWTYSCTASKPVKSIYFDAAAISTDGTQCTTPAEVTLNSGPKTWAFSCADNAASVFYGKVRMPKAWDAGTVTFTVAVSDTDSSAHHFAGDFVAQCHAAGETVDNSYGSSAGVVDVTLTTANITYEGTSGATTPAGTCAAEDWLYWKFTVAAAGAHTDANARVLGVALKYSLGSMSD